MPLCNPISIVGNRARRSVFDSTLTVGESVSAALGIYEGIKDGFHANLLSEISNYSKWPLSNAQYNILHGQTSELPLFIRSGYTEGFNIHQKDGKQYVEGMTSWTVSKGYFCMFYWRVEGKLLVQKKGNMIGVGCATSDKSLNDFADEIANGYDQGETAHWTFKVYSGSVQVKAQYCTAEICLQAICGSRHQTTATVYVIPVKAENLATDLKEVITQNDIDLLIVDTECQIYECNSDSPLTGWAAMTLVEQVFAIIGIIAASLAVFVVFIVACVKYFSTHQQVHDSSQRAQYGNN